ncbi:hypothetical protein PRK78_002259 [Emydomyces testavorans]|uniref:Small ribosomal subunit protein mS38 n=1 Tax=Emydomyces testavorans TaxID=2070801 RepID=A0AAF0IJH1_9EURO|nr:hypothetical protein PRK78_002259 [Emydomyces testavorans]
MARTPAVSLPAVTPRPSTIVFASCASNLTAPRGHQRRYSSSKPPVPPSDGSRGIDAPSQAPAKSVSPSKKDEAEKRPKRRTKESKSKPETSLNLPSVPSTQHLHPQGSCHLVLHSHELDYSSTLSPGGQQYVFIANTSQIFSDIHVASFFSIHRPMSVTTSVPPASTSEAFSTIFSSKRQAKAQQNDVIYTIASAVNVIESALPRNQRAAEDNDLRAAVTQASTSNAEPEMTHLDGVPMQDLRVSVQEFAKRLRPFNPPPPPVPIDETKQANSLEVDAEAVQAEQSYSTVLTIRESSHADGSKSYEAYTTPFVRVEEVEAPAGVETNAIEEQKTPETARLPSRFLDRMRIRQLRWEAYMERRNRSMHAISVKRQRKLKMKKHKHKKLMRKTRNLRRKLEKT